MLTGWHEVKQRDNLVAVDVYGEPDGLQFPMDQFDRLRFNWHRLQPSLVSPVDQHGLNNLVIVFRSNEHFFLSSQTQPSGFSL